MLLIYYTKLRSLTVRNYVLWTLMNNSASEKLTNFDQCPERQRGQDEPWNLISTTHPHPAFQKDYFCRLLTLHLAILKHNSVRHLRAIKTILVFTFETDLRWNMYDFLLVSQHLIWLLSPWSDFKKSNFRTGAVSDELWAIIYNSSSSKANFFSCKTPRSQLILCINWVIYIPFPLLPLILRHRN